MGWILDLNVVRGIMNPATDEAVRHVYNIMLDISLLFTRPEVESEHIRYVVFEKIRRNYNRALASLMVLSPWEIRGDAYIRGALESITRDLTQQARSIAANRDDNVIRDEDVDEALSTNPIWYRGLDPINPD